MLPYCISGVLDWKSRVDTGNSRASPIAAREDLRCLKKKRLHGLVLVTPHNVAFDLLAVYFMVAIPSDTVFEDVTTTSNSRISF